MLARHISLRRYHLALQVLHPEAFVRHLAGRVVSVGEILGFINAGRVQIDFTVTECLSVTLAVQIISETAFEVDVNPVHVDNGCARDSKRNDQIVIP